MGHVTIENLELKESQQFYAFWQKGEMTEENLLHSGLDL